MKTLVLKRFTFVLLKRSKNVFWELNENGFLITFLKRFNNVVLKLSKKLIFELLSLQHYFGHVVLFKNVSFKPPFLSSADTEKHAAGRVHNHTHAPFLATLPERMKSFQCFEFEVLPKFKYKTQNQTRESFVLVTSFFTKKIHLIDASTQTENVYGLQPIETKIDEIKTELSSLTKKRKLYKYPFSRLSLKNFQK